MITWTYWLVEFHLEPNASFHQRQYTSTSCISACMFHAVTEHCAIFLSSLSTNNISTKSVLIFKWAFKYLVWLRWTYIYVHTYIQFATYYIWHPAAENADWQSQNHYVSYSHSAAKDIYINAYGSDTSQQSNYSPSFVIAVPDLRIYYNDKTCLFLPKLHLLQLLGVTRWHFDTWSTFSWVELSDLLTVYLYSTITRTMDPSASASNPIYKLYII